MRKRVEKWDCRSRSTARNTVVHVLLLSVSIGSANPSNGEVFLYAGRLRMTENEFEEYAHSAVHDAMELNERCKDQWGLGRGTTIWTKRS